MIKPIPRRMLQNTATYKPVTGKDKNGVITYGASVALTYVRVEPVRKSAHQKEGEFNDDKFTLFFDSRNSRPIDQSFTKLDKIVFQGDTLTIREAQRLYADQSGNVIHHWEIMLN